MPIVPVALSALAQGLTIAALGFAFALVYWTTRVFFVALGAIYAVAPFLVMELQPHLGVAGAVILTTATASWLSLVLGWAHHERLLQEKATDGIHFACSLTLYFLAAELIVWHWGSDVRSLAGLSGVSEFAAGRSCGLPNSQLAAIGACSGLVVATFLTLRYSSYGVKLRAMADNPAELARSGYNPVLLRAIAFLASGLIAGGASVAVAVDLAVGAHSGLLALIPAATATLLTPLGRWTRLLTWSLGLGLLRTLVTFMVSGAWQDPVTMGLLLLALLGRRQWGWRIRGLRAAFWGAR
ncbi:MAG: hypothetical protein M3O15_00740 [Acidobacteriota bacterium]|nr:hypothetical protein [Acidobacteriota bacterium]